MVLVLVTVRWADGMTHDDGMSGSSVTHAMARARANWPNAVAISLVDVFGLADSSEF